MAEHEYIIGSLGPYFYDDADLNDDGSNMEALYTATGGYNVNTGQVQTAPSAGPDVVRFADMPWAQNPTFADVSGSRAIGGIYQNTSGTLIRCQISIRLSA